MSSPSDDALWQQAGEALSAADALVITAGAGMGVDSGLPDFRGPQGFWRAYPALARLGLEFEQMAQPFWFLRDPALAWAFYGHRLLLYRRTEPHAGFQLLRALMARCRLGGFVFTSNVDGHFQRAGFAPEQVVECHGSLHHLQCVRPCSVEITPADGVELVVDEAAFRAVEPLPRCPRCGALQRPNVLMFGDGHWISDRTDGQWARMVEWLGRCQRESARLVVVELGAGTSIPTVRIQSEQLVAETGGRLIRLNLREPEVPDGHIGLACGALAGLQRLCRTLD